MFDDSQILKFPEGVVDQDGRRLRPGAVVRVPGDQSIPVSEVIGYDESGDVVLVTDADEPEVLLVPPHALRTVGELLRAPVTVGEPVVQGEDERVALIVPIGSQDVQQRPGVTNGLLPNPKDFLSQRETSQRVDARWWGEAILETLVSMPPDDAATVAFEELDAPMLRRAIEEAAVPRSIDRIVLVVTDQAIEHRDDTVSFAHIIEHWLNGARLTIYRTLPETLDVLILRDAPHIVSAVSQQVQELLPSSIKNCDSVLVVAAGGTPAMTYGTLIASFTTELPVRHIQVPFGQPVIEIDLDYLLSPRKLK
jgi:nitrate reductase NapAB chaperone NapD